MRYNRDDLMILHDESNGSWVLKVVATNSTLVRFPDRETVEELAEHMIKAERDFVKTSRASETNRQDYPLFSIDLARAC